MKCFPEVENFLDMWMHCPDAKHRKTAVFFLIESILFSKINNHSRKCHFTIDNGGGGEAKNSSGTIFLEAVIHFRLKNHNFKYFILLRVDESRAI